MRKELKYLIKSNVAERNGIDNVPKSPEILENLEITHKAFLFIRNNFTNLRINSGYRCLELNTKIGGSKTSSHMQGLAMDIECNWISNLYLHKWILDHLDNFDQLILEYYVVGVEGSGWVHVSFAPKGAKARRQVLIKDHGKPYKVVPKGSYGTHSSY